QVVGGSTGCRDDQLSVRLRAGGHPAAVHPVALCGGNLSDEARRSLALMGAKKGPRAAALSASVSLQLRRLIAEHGFDFEEFLEAVFAPFATRSGLLIAAERRVEVGAGAVQ